MAECKSCGAPIRWAASARTWKPLPLDAAAVEDGNLVIVREKGESVARAATADDIRLKRELFKSHFATCPQAASWRQPKQEN